ncbi:MAG TPA: 3'(2'),5'-bisphosphate nucleotidase CysQ [Terriglobales bacterium]|jgi:myo-inositol-1(or 4)-monophosphatase|nr:3'(2'),5'-bisphosphate nucleotidase CysQ [Terriglobales bacterium]
MPIYSDVLERIQLAIEKSKQVFKKFTPGEIEAEYKAGQDPVTQADKELDVALRASLLRKDEGWLSEESADDLSRLNCERVWVVDPLDGTREFVAGIPEFCVSIAFVEGGKAVAGGIFNPATEELFLGSTETGLTYNGAPRKASSRTTLAGASVLASRSETSRGEWDCFRNAKFCMQPTGSVAYKLARVAAGLADLTFTLTPKHEWDIAAGIALVHSGGGFARPLDRPEFIFNQTKPLLPGLLACGPQLRGELLALLGIHDPVAAAQS